MMATLSARDRRVLGIGAATILGLLLVLRGVPAWWDWRANTRAAAAESIGRWLAMQTTLEGLPRALDTLEARTARMREMGPAFFTGTTLADASAMLTAMVGEMARASQVRLDAMDVRIDSASDPRRPRIRLEAQATADIAGLAELVERLEKGPPLLAVTRIAVRPHNPDTPAEQIETLALRFTVEGLALLRPRRGENR